MPSPLQRRRILRRFQDGIHLDFTRDFHYVKEQGGKVTRAPFTSLFSLTRGAPDATFRGQNGLIQTATTNIPRIEYSTTGTLLGFLIESSRTNGLLQSRDQTQAAWVKTTMTAAQDQVGADGVTNSASSLLATGANATSLQTIVQAAVSSTLSFDIKRLIGTGTIGICQDGATFTDVTAQINSTTYTRVTLTASQLNPVLGIQLGSNGDKIAVDFGGFEAGGFASSRIPTTAGSVSRASDAIQRTFGAEYTAALGTTFVEMDRIDLTLGARGIFGTGNNGRNLYVPAAQPTKIAIYDGTTECISSSALTANVMAKAASAFDANGMAVTVNGAAVTTAAYDGTFGAGETTIVLGDVQVGGNVQPFGHIRRLDFWPERKSNAFLQQITT